MSTRGKEKATRAYRRILWPTDFSRLAKAALPHAERLAASSGAELVVLHVLMGSVAENVVRRAPCPVLTVRPPRFTR
jgi:nucleotide-binding universal stress UspA family protein